MPCGCRKNPNNRIVRSAKLARAKQEARLAAKRKNKKMKNGQLAQRRVEFDSITTRLTICKGCPHSSYVDSAKICSKLNKSIKDISIDPNIKCPTAQF